MHFTLNVYSDSFSHWSGIVLFRRYSRFDKQFKPIFLLFVIVIPHVQYSVLKFWPNIFYIVHRVCKLVQKFYWIGPRSCIVWKRSLREVSHINLDKNRWDKRNKRKEIKWKERRKEQIPDQAKVFFYLNFVIMDCKPNKYYLFGVRPVKKRQALKFLFLIY